MGLSTEKYDGIPSGFNTVMSLLGITEGRLGFKGGLKARGSAAIVYILSPSASIAPVKASAYFAI
jgi:hypothetical protein